MNKQKKRLLSLVDAFSQKKIAVWGDYILDEYVYGNTRRISREAPVLILSYKSREFALGGAGNSLLNLKALGAIPLPIGVLGSDETGEKIIFLVKERGISTSGLIKEKSYKTPLKTRILAGEQSTRKQQILRIDREERVPDSEAVERRVKNKLKDIQCQIHALLISDYNYFTVKESVFDQILPDFQKTKIPVTLDSRFRVLNFQGITAATPNEPEVEEALRVEINDHIQVIKQAARIILKKIQAPALLITRGSKGMILFERKKPPFIIPIHGTADIVDVTGAGDTVISVFTLALACGASFKEAALLANYAGGTVVMKKGTATLTPRELKQAIKS
ncbi:MAG: bifunctional heptose 7-phosphate kinase/heptose 1-phosphate adenyltransferase [Candidatus Aminicenantes bacterium]